MNRGLAVTLLLGVVFLSLQVYDYYVLLTHDHFGIDSGIYGTLFYTMTGFHGAHVFGGVVGISVILVRVRCRDSSRRSTTSRSRRSVPTGTSLTWCGSPCSQRSIC